MRLGLLCGYVLAGQCLSAPGSARGASVPASPWGQFWFVYCAGTFSDATSPVPDTWLEMTCSDRCQEDPEAWGAEDVSWIMVLTHWDLIWGLEQTSLGWQSSISSGDCRNQDDNVLFTRCLSPFLCTGYHSTMGAESVPFPLRTQVRRQADPSTCLSVLITPETSPFYPQVHLLCSLAVHKCPSAMEWIILRLILVPSVVPGRGHPVGRKEKERVQGQNS